MSAMPFSSSSSSSRRADGKGSTWRYDAGDGQALVIRAEPLVDGQRTSSSLQPGVMFTACEEKVGEDGVLYLKLADGRGWVFDRKPGVGHMCERHVEREAVTWRYDAGDGQPLVLRKGPQMNGERTQHTLRPGEAFAVSKEQEGADGVVFLRLSDGRGWAFDHKPGTGVMCERQGARDADVSPSPYWTYASRDAKPIFFRESADINANRLEENLQPGERFCASEEKRGTDGVLYLKVDDRRGWLFDTKPGVGVMCRRHEAPVILHIYDVPSDPTALKINAMLRALGTGAFHAGVEVFGLEWSFGANYEGAGGTGVFACPPRTCEGHTYRESLHMGHTPMTEDEARAMIGRLSKEWLAKDYDILRRNCTHFSDVLCRSVKVGEIPTWVRSLSGAARTLDDGRASLREAVAPVVSTTKDMVAAVVARGKEARGNDVTEDWQHGDFTVGLVTVAAEVAGQAASKLDGVVGQVLPRIDCTKDGDEVRRNEVRRNEEGKIPKRMECQGSP